MATKTISLELDAYQKLKRAKRNPRESFSSVVRRAVWPANSHSAAELLALMKARMESGKGLLDEKTLDELDRIQASPHVSESEW